VKEERENTTITTPKFRNKKNTDWEQEKEKEQKKKGKKEKKDRREK
jgi:hypothetical protein